MKDESFSKPIVSRINNQINENAAILQKISLPNTIKEVEVYLKREDLIHPQISGNKWRKLKYNLQFAKDNSYDTLLTFGGAYSNHIHATASAGKIFSFKTIGIIRGEEHLPLNNTLSDAKIDGMEIFYVDRSTYRNKHSEKFIEELKTKFGNFYLIPEGGTNQLAIKGCKEIVTDIKIDYDYIITACGTGGTISGIICGNTGNNKIIGIPVLKGAQFLYSEIYKLVNIFSGKVYNNWQLNYNYHFGGYAKVTKELVLFMLEFEKVNDILLEPIYTGKMLFALKEMINNGEIKKGSKVIAIHTGGLQGRRGMKQTIEKFYKK